MRRVMLNMHATFFCLGWVWLQISNGAITPGRDFDASFTMSISACLRFGGSQRP
jgi:hypothetical protein